MSEIYTAEWEWLVHLLFRETGTRYTREHAEVVADITQVMNELGKTLKCKGLNSPSDSLPVLQECFWSDRGKNLRTRMLHAGSTLNETRKETGIDLNITAKNNEEPIVPYQNIVTNLKAKERRKTVLHQKMLMRKRQGLLKTQNLLHVNPQREIHRKIRINP